MTWAYHDKKSSKQDICPSFHTTNFAIMHELPVELQTLCLTFLGDDVATLKALRSTNKQLGCLATEALMKVAVVKNDENSGQRFVSLAGSDLNSLVRCIVINTSDNPYPLPFGEREKAEITQSFNEAIGSMGACRELEELQLNFSYECAVEDDLVTAIAEREDFRSTILKRVLVAIRQTDSVKCLAIKNLQDSHDEEIFCGEDFINIRKRISKLHLEIASQSDEGAPEYDIEKPALHAGFSDALPRIWLKPMGNQLTHLSLYGQALWGVWPILDFRQVPPLPHLKSLSLGNFMIAHDWQIDWIAAHSTTLSALYMDDCSIVTALRMSEQMAQANFPGLEPLEHDGEYPSGVGPEYHTEVPLRWYDVFERFRNDLPRLSHFAFGSGDWDTGTAFEERYQLRNFIHEWRYYMFNDGYGPSPWIDENPYNFELGGYIDEETETATLREPCDREDEEALESLLQAVQVRLAEKV
jgi:hypothetical protein